VWYADVVILWWCGECFIGFFCVGEVIGGVVWCCGGYLWCVWCVDVVKIALKGLFCGGVVSVLSGFFALIGVLGVCGGVVVLVLWWWCWVLGVGFNYRVVVL